MDETPNLSLPYILASQAQKHVTHNEAIRMLDALVQLSVLDRDLAAPPAGPADGARYLVASPASGAWTDQEGRIAAWQDGAWAFIEPAAGWVAWFVDEAVLCVFDGSSWIEAAAAQPAPPEMLGVNMAADGTNRLAVSSEATLFTHDGDDHRMVINKAGAGDTATILFQSAFSGRAEIGLSGDERLGIKVSANGADWIQAMTFDEAGRDLRGYATAVPTGGISASVQYNGSTTGASSFSMTRWSADDAGPAVMLRKSRGAVGVQGAMQPGDTLGSVQFGGSTDTQFTAGSEAQIRSVAETSFATDRTARFEFQTRNAGAMSEKLRITGSGQVHFPAVGTTASGANAFLDSSASPANQLLRSTSSLAYKTDVEPLDDELADAFLRKARPIWYRSLASADKRDDGSPKSFYSFAAEELAAIDPRLVTWGYRPDDWQIVVATDQDGNESTERRLEHGAQRVPDGVNDRAVLAMLVGAVQHWEKRLAALEAEQRAVGR